MLSSSLKNTPTLISFIIAAVCATAGCLTACGNALDKGSQHLEGNTEYHADSATENQEAADQETENQETEIQETRLVKHRTTKFPAQAMSQEMSATAAPVRLSQPSFQVLTHPHASPDFSSQVGRAIAPSGNVEHYENLPESGYKDPLISPLSTFGLDVDTASYSNIRRFIREGQLPPQDAVRLEEMINYFDYPVEFKRGEHPLEIRSELDHAPWDQHKRLAMIQVVSHELKAEQQRPKRFVFLVDTSGSMQGTDRLPLLKQAFQGLIEQLGSEDRVAIVAYAGSAGVVLPSVSGSEKNVISQALLNLRSGGSTAGAAGIEEAYRIARSQFDPKANNRVILATDGDFNVGLRHQGELIELIEKQRESGIFLTVLGFGRGNLGDARMHRIADHGDGNYYYIDSEMEARRVLVDRLAQSLVTVARDVKLQVEFNPAKVSRYRLLGYESRVMAAEDFRDDEKDAGEVGAGQVVTALYELELRHDQRYDRAASLRYQETNNLNTKNKNELMQVSLRYRPLTAGVTRELRHIVDADAAKVSQSQNLDWAAAVAEYAMLLKNSDYKTNANISQLLLRAEKLAQGGDETRREFVSLVRQTMILQQNLASAGKVLEPANPRMH